MRTPVHISPLRLFMRWRRIVGLATATMIGLIVATNVIAISGSLQLPELRRLLGYPLCAVVTVAFVVVAMRAAPLCRGMLPPVAQRLHQALLWWGIICIFRSIEPTSTGFRNLLFTYWGAMTMVLPVMLYCGASALFWAVFFENARIMTWVGVFYVGLQIVLKSLDQSTLQNFHSNDLLFFCPIFVMSGFLFGARYFWLGATGLSLWLVNAFLVDARHAMALIFWFGLCTAWETLRSHALAVRRVKPLLLGAGAALALSIVFATQVSAWVPGAVFSARFEQFFLSGGMLANTRGGAARDFMAKMDAGDLLLGRGAVATYETQLVALAQDYLQGSRRLGIEIGYLDQILKGGIVLVLLFLAVAVSAAILGLFRSRNHFTRCLAYVIVGWLLLMLTAAVPRGEMRYVLFWLAVGGCLSRELRAMTNADLVNLCMSGGRPPPPPSIVDGDVPDEGPSPAAVADPSGGVRRL